MLKKNWTTFGFFTLLITLALLPVQVSCSNSISATQPLFASAGLYELPSGANFSIIWITDTQYLSESYPTYYDSLCRWIVNHAEEYKVEMVIHTGDIVEDEFNRTHWENANQSMSILLDAGIPYCWNAGNHDYNETCWIGNQYAAFNPEALSTKTYWIDDAVDGQNTAVQFSVNNWTCLIINIAYEASDDVLDWANNLLDACPESHAIVGAHVYLNTTGGYDGKGRDDPDWPTNLKTNVLDTHSNVFLTLSGHHYPASGSRTTLGGRHELMYNRQDTDNQLGAASLRIMAFNLVEGTIEVETYYLYANHFLDDSNNQFTLTTTFRNKDLPEANEATEFPMITVIFVSVIVVVVVLSVSYWLSQRHHSYDAI
ncbi:MAG: metallophosphoesterase [Candidatus Bathyarchaeota archaeon]|nr:metallophosphoesterase [Candidatus Bathyarchaeum sp.]